MLFTTLNFVLFLAVVLGLFYILPRPLRRYLLLASSLFFYMAWNAKFVVLILSLITIDFFAALWIVHKEGHQRRTALLISLCANIGRQFEFVQNAWLMSTKFNGLTGESDPLLGNRAAAGDDPATARFSIPREGKLTRRLSGVPQFITVRGGAYFFLPSLRALRYIARIGKTGSASRSF